MLSNLKLTIYCDVEHANRNCFSVALLTGAISTISVCINSSSATATIESWANNYLRWRTI